MILLFTPDQFTAFVTRILAPLLVVLRRVGLWLWYHWVGHKRRVIRTDWMELEFAPLELRGERETVLAAVKQDWRALEFAADCLKADKEIVQDAVSQSWRALRFASRDLRSDRDLMIGAVRQSNGWALEFAAEELYQDQELVTEATARLGGPLGLPLTPITTFVPVGPEVENAGVAHPGGRVLRTYGLQAVPIEVPEEEGAGAEEAGAAEAGQMLAEGDVQDTPENAASGEEDGGRQDDPVTAELRREMRASAAEARMQSMSREWSRAAENAASGNASTGAASSHPVVAGMGLQDNAARTEAQDYGNEESRRRCEVHLHAQLSRCGCWTGLQSMFFPRRHQ